MNCGIAGGTIELAVYTHVPVDEIAEFLTRYDVGELLSAKGIAEGIENSNYLVETTADRFILTLYEKRVKEADLPFFIDLLEHLSARGCRTWLSRCALAYDAPNRSDPRRRLSRQCIDRRERGCRADRLLFQLHGHPRL